MRSLIRNGSIRVPISEVCWGLDQGLRIISAMAAGVSAKLWSLTDMVRVIDE
jgi:hypothetical protein